MSQVFIVAKFLNNQDFIAQNLCENKDKPVLKCNGKCQLAKELEQNEEKQTNQTIPEISISLFIPMENQMEIFCPRYYKTIKTFPLSNIENTLPGALSNVFHPPC
jgi:hypothetical protein